MPPPPPPPVSTPHEEALPPISTPREEAPPPVSTPREEAPPPVSIPREEAPPPAPILSSEACPVCGLVNPVGEEFCQKCGLVLSTPEGIPAPSLEREAIEPEPASPEVEPAPEITSVEPMPVTPPVEIAAPPPVSGPITQQWPPLESTPVIVGKLFSPATNSDLPLPPKSEIIIGRADPDRGIFPDIDLGSQGQAAVSVSRRHARLYLQGEQILVEDLNSTNSTYLNKIRIAPGQPALLKSGDELRLGGITLVYCAE